MKLSIIGEYHSYEIKVCSRYVLLNLESGQWYVTNGLGDYVMPPFRRKGDMEAILHVVDTLLETEVNQKGLKP